jgi:hypothetical protein
MQSDKYAKLKKARYRKQLKETNDCSVMAIAIACRLSYKKAHDLMAAYGRKNRQGANNFAILQAARSLGFEITAVNNLVQGNGCGYTVTTIGEKCKSGYYLAFVRGHVLGVVNGEIYDWTEGRRHRVNEVYKVTRKRG